MFAPVGAKSIVLNLLWNTKVGSSMPISAFSDKGNLGVGSGNLFYVFDPSGKIIVQRTNSGPIGTVASHGDIFAYSYSGRIVTIKDDGTVLADFWAGSGYSSTLVLTSNSVIGCGGSGCARFSLSGEKIWEYNANLSNFSFGKVTVGPDGNIYFSYSQLSCDIYNVNPQCSGIYVLEYGNGQRLTEYKLMGRYILDINFCDKYAELSFYEELVVLPGFISLVIARIDTSFSSYNVIGGTTIYGTSAPFSWSKDCKYGVWMKNDVIGALEVHEDRVLNLVGPRIPGVGGIVLGKIDDKDVAAISFGDGTIGVYEVQFGQVYDKCM